MYGLIKVSKGLLSPSRCFYLKIKKYLHNMTTLNCEIDEKSAEFKVRKIYIYLYNFFVIIFRK